MAVEEPKYTALVSDGACELRRYAPVIVAEVRVTGSGEPIGVELDGEAAEGRDLTFQVRPGLLQLLT